LVISRETDYAIRIIRALSNKDKLTIAEICEIEFLPMPFAYKILRELDKANIVRVWRGRNGGCELAKDLDKITLYDIIQALDSSPYVSACLRDNFICNARGPHKTCTVHSNLEQLQRDIDKKLMTLNMAKLFRAG
jgi:Rrf2 family protein